MRDSGFVDLNDASDTFSILCEIEPAVTPDLRRVRRQIVAFDGVTDLFLIPDNHIGRATVSSIAVSKEVADLGGTAIACVNSRDRNLLGFRRDLLTAAAYGVQSFLLVRGDDPVEGSRSDLTVRQMLIEARSYPDAEFTLGVTARAGAAVPAWKHEADFWLVQATFDMDALLSWRRSVDFTGKIYAGVLVLASAKMAARIATDLPEISVPPQLINDLELDGDAGVHRALDMVAAIKDSGAFDGVHLVPVSRYQQVARLLRG
jgi:methylenetetrahydrofolate reductase (NADPH)